MSYRFQLSATADFRAPMVDEASLAEPRFTPPAPLPPGRYYWRVATNSEREAKGRSPILSAFAGRPTGRQPSRRRSTTRC